MASTTPQYVTQDTSGSDSDLQELAKRHLWMHFTRMSAYQDAEVPIITRGEGCYVYDEAGKRYFDGLAALFCVNAGHGRTEIGEAMAEQVKDLGFFTNWSYAHPTAIKLAKRIADLAPGDLNRVFFTSGGSEAVESALKLCRLYHRKHGEAGRFKLIAREIAYHGTTMGALSATGIPDLRAPFEPMLPGNAHAPNTNSYRWPEDRDPLWAAEQIEETILFEGPETVSAVILEPVQNAGGCFVPQEGYWQKVREICDKYGVLLISDEVICSWGRLGHYFGAQRFDYQPDLITTAKGLTSAYSPMGAVIASDKVAEVFMEGTNMFTHGITFGGHPVSAAAAMANLDIFENEDLCGRVRENEAEFRSQLESLRELPIVGDVRGAGYFYGIELVKDQDTKESFDDDESEWLLRGFLSGALYEQGLICRADDRGDPVIQLSPPLIAGPEEFERDHGHPAQRADRSLREAGEQVAGGATPGPRNADAAHAAGGDGAGPDHGRRVGGRARALGAHHRAARPHAVAVGRRADPDHGPAADDRRAPARVRAPARRPPAGGPRLRRRVRARRACREPLVDEAAKHGFPVFEVPYDLPFIAITEKAFARLVNEQYEVLQRGIAIHKRLERLVIEERGLDELVRALAAALGGTVTVIDAHGEPIAHRTFRRELDEGVLDSVRAEVRAEQAAHESGARRDGRAGARAPGGGGPVGRAAGVHARARGAAGVAVRRPRLRRARGLRAADPPAGHHRGRARADAPARDARHRAAAGRRRAGRGADRPAGRARAGLAAAPVRRGRRRRRCWCSPSTTRWPRRASWTGSSTTAATAPWWPRARTCCARSWTPATTATRWSWRARRAAELGGRGGPPRAAASRADAGGRAAAVVQRGPDRAGGHRASPTATRPRWPPTATWARRSCC